MTDKLMFMASWYDCYAVNAARQFGLEADWSDEQRRIVEMFKVKAEECRRQADGQAK